MFAKVSRRAVLRGAAAAVSGASFIGALKPSTAGAATGIAVLSPRPPDPAPPGVVDVAATQFARWKIAHNVYLNYEAVAWSAIHDKLVSVFRAGTHVYDVFYMAGWIPEFAENLAPLDGLISPSPRADLPSSAGKSVTWGRHTLGVPTTLSLLTLFYNAEHFSRAGISAPPTTWDDLKRVAAELTRDGRFGWRQNYGQPAGIGGAASYWMVFLQQAGGTLYDSAGQPAFDNAAGVDALNLMLDLLPSTDPRSLTDMSIVDSTLGLRDGSSSMGMNWPFMWATVQTDPGSPVAGKIANAVLPAGAAGSASLDGCDAWTIAADSKVKREAVELLEFYLDRDVQKQQALLTGWLPIRISVYEDEEIRARLPHAAVVLDQARHPYQSFLTPDYTAVTTAIGNEVLSALRGQKVASAAIKDAAEAVRAIVAARTR